jgi:hypothetical protein
MPTTKDTHEFVDFRPDGSLIDLDDAVPFSFGYVAKGGHSCVI